MSRRLVLHEDLAPGTPVASAERAHRRENQLAITPHSPAGSSRSAGGKDPATLVLTGDAGSEVESGAGGATTDSKPSRVVVTTSASSRGRSAAEDAGSGADDVLDKEHVDVHVDSGSDVDDGGADGSLAGGSPAAAKADSSAAADDADHAGSDYGGDDDGNVADDGADTPASDMYDGIGDPLYTSSYHRHPLAECTGHRVSEFYCDVCFAHLQGGEQALSYVCVACEFDMCAACVQREKDDPATAASLAKQVEIHRTSCTHEHPLTGEVGPRYRDNVCDSCKMPVFDRGPLVYCCVACNYDLCNACLEREQKYPALMRKASRVLENKRLEAKRVAEANAKAEFETNTKRKGFTTRTRSTDWDEYHRRSLSGGGSDVEDPGGPDDATAGGAASAAAGAAEGGGKHSDGAAGRGGRTGGSAAAAADEESVDEFTAALRLSLRRLGVFTSCVSLVVVTWITASAVFKGEFVSLMVFPLFLGLFTLWAAFVSLSSMTVRVRAMALHWNVVLAVPFLLIGVPIVIANATRVGGVVREFCFPQSGVERCERPEAMEYLAIVAAAVGILVYSAVLINIMVLASKAMTAALAVELDGFDVWLRSGLPWKNPKFYGLSLGVARLAFDKGLIGSLLSSASCGARRCRLYPMATLWASILVFVTLWLVFLLLPPILCDKDDASGTWCLILEVAHAISTGEPAFDR